MTPDKIVVIISGVAGLAFVAWFFFGKKETETVVHGTVNITVSGGYNPQKIVLQKGKQVALTFFRTDPGSCLEEVVIPDFKIRRFLPLQEKVRIMIKPERTGEFTISCGMSMFHGTIVVRG